MNYLSIFSILLSSMLVVGCGSKSANNHTGEHTTTESHEGHDHEAEGTAAHNHEGECTEDHAHEAQTENHEGHDHEAEGTAAHNHEGECTEDHAHEAQTESHEGHDHEAEVVKAEVSHAGEIIFTQAQAATTNFKVQEIFPTTFSQIIPATGVLIPAQGEEAFVAAPVSGIVSFSGKKISEGVAVNRGERLFTISSRNIAEGDYTVKIKNAYNQAKTEFERAERLVADKIVSNREYEQSKLAYENAKATYDALVTVGDGRGSAVSTSIGGFVKSILISEGQYVEVGQPLAVISQNRKVMLRADVSQRYYTALQGVSTANFKTPYDNKTYELKQLNGRLISIGKSAGIGSALIPVTFEFDNKMNLVLGSFVDVYLISSQLKNQIVIPLTSLIEEQGILSVFVQLDAEGYVKKEVTVGGNNGVDVQILSGLKAGDKVVTKGGIHIKMASMSSAIPHGHAH